MTAPTTRTTRHFGVVFEEPSRALAVMTTAPPGLAPPAARSARSRRGAVRPKARYRPGADLPGVIGEPCAADFEDLENDRTVER